MWYTGINSTKSNDKLKGRYSMKAYITGILAVACVASLGGNFYLYGNNRAMQQQLAQQQEQIAQLTVQAEEADTTIADLQSQLEQAEAEQSTQGATDKVTPQAPSGDEAIKQDIEQQLPQTTPQAPDPDKDYSSMSGNDLLEEILGNNNIPSGGTSSGGNSNQFDNLDKVGGQGYVDENGTTWYEGDPNAELEFDEFDPSLWE